MYVGAVFFPLLGACLAGFLGRWLGDKASQWVTVFCMALAAACGIGAFVEVAMGSAPGVVPIVTFIDVGGFEVEWALRYDTLSVVMVAMVTFISTLIHLYSVGYMSHDATIPRFFAYLSLFTFMMLMLVTADNLVAALLRLGGRGPRELPADRLLVRARERQPRGDEGLHRQPRSGDFFFMLGWR
jgi:NADH-quinone oxidoreductase subunit L